MKSTETPTAVDTKTPTVVDTKTLTAVDNVIYLKRQIDPQPLRVISVASGKGGVGKTNLVTNMAVHLAQRGKRVLVIDADLGLGNVDVLLGLNPRYNLKHVLTDGIPIQQVLVEGPHGMRLLPATSGDQEMTDLNDAQKWQLLGELESLEAQFDTVLIDTAAGIANNVLYFASAAQDIVIIINPEPTSLTDAYALIKVLTNKCGVEHFHLVVNEVDSEQEARQVYEQLAGVVGQFLSAQLSYLQHIPRDENINRAVMHQRPAVDAFPHSPASRCMAAAADRLTGNPPASDSLGGLKLFWKTIFFSKEDHQCKP